jgi:signal transduction histidine kinase
MNSVIHEIRNHLAVAVASVEGFRDGVLAPTPERLNAVLHALAEAEALLGEIPRGPVPGFDDAPEMHVMNVCDVVSSELLGLEATAAKRGVDFTVKQCATTEAACRAFHGNPVRIGEIVNNVVGNAIRYTPPGGRIDIDCRHTDGSLILTVTDGGPGVAPEERLRIFEAGYRGTAAAGLSGSGLGLGLARRFVEAHGGSITLGDSDEPGARFIISLPGTPLTIPVRTTADGTVSLL